MSGDTHAAVGAAVSGVVAVSLSNLLSIPTSKESLFIGMVIGAVGGLFPDLDSRKSKGNKLLNKALLVIIPIVLCLCILIYLGKFKFNDLGISTEQLISSVVFLGIAIFARTRPHREFTHSFLVCAVTTACVYVCINSTAWIWFGVGYLSHLAIDYPNEKGESLLWPLPSKFCLHLCSSSGIANKVCRYAGLLLATVIIIIG